MPGFQRRHLAIACILLAIFFPTLYLLTTSSVAYETAEIAIATSKDVGSIAGDVARIRLRFWDGFSLHDGIGGSANFSFSVQGSKQNVVVYIRLKNEAGKWEVDELVVH